MESNNQYTDSLFRNLYNDHQEYKEIRAEGNGTYEKYMDDVRYWKLKYIEKLLTNNGLKDAISSVGEIGCATGVLLATFLWKRRNLKRVGIDISDDNIVYAKNKFPECHFFRGTFDDYISNSKNELPFDLMIMSDILEHVEEDVELVRNAGANAKYVVINLPIEKVPEYKDRVYGVDDVEGHLRAYSVEDALDMCEKAGMKVIQYYVKQYVLQPTFRKYLFNKLMRKHQNKVDALIQYHQELLEVDLDPDHYKKNFYALLTNR